MRVADYIDGQESRRAFEAIARATVANGGGTFHHKTGAEIDLQAKHAGGFVVSIEEYGSNIVTPVASAWERIARLWPRTIGAGVQYVGTWVDGSVVFVDGAVVVSTREHAEILARKHGQRAYFDIDAGESVYLACGRCGASLTEYGSVTYVERYDARLYGGHLEVLRHTLDSDAQCARCGAPLPGDWQPEFG